MSFVDILYTIIIGPLQLAFEIIYSLAYRSLDNYGLSIIVLSLAMNILVLPLYNRADKMQEEQRLTEARLKRGIDHIKKTFHGDDRMMMLQTYYRQNNYSPLSALKGSVSLLLEIPFFIAAYNFLSHLEILEGVSFGPISDLSKADGLLSIGSLNINILPILMTLINLLSCLIYTKNATLKSKIQLYAMAVFFLFFLYTCPSGLVFYWTLNNLFSLCKTIVYKLLEHRKSRPNLKKTTSKLNVSRKGFVIICAFLTLFIGCLIPSAVINDSPLEFISPAFFYNPLWYVGYSLCLSAGFFLLWMQVFFSLANEKGKYYFDLLLQLFSIVAIVNYMFFGRDLGIMNSSLIFDTGLVFTAKEKLLNLVAVILVLIIFGILFTHIKDKFTPVALILTFSVGVMGVINTVNIGSAVSDYHQSSTDRGFPNVTLSENGSNVIVIMLDRAMGLYVPYIMNEKPKLLEQFDGFTYYDNVISYGAYTNFGTPSLLGGYEYTPEEMNKRDTELLVDKHNEALKVMPVIFSSQGYNVTLFNPPYANYQWIPDLSIYDEYEDIHAYNTYGLFTSQESLEFTLNNTKRSFFCYSVMKVLPEVIQKYIYNDGKYNSLSFYSEEAYLGQSVTGTSTATGLSSEAADYYHTLENLKNITSVNSEINGSFLFYDCELTHDVMLYDETDYSLSSNIDNSAYDAAHADRFTVNGRTLTFENETQYTHYESNMAAFILLGQWFDYLRECGVYDNTRIILVADHGSATGNTDDLLISDDGSKFSDAEYYFPLLMVKDFNSTGFTTSSEFMTNADTPTLAMEGIIENPTNPFTGKVIDSSLKYEDNCYILASDAWGVNFNNSTVYYSGEWLSVHDNIWDKNNWEIVQKESTSPREYKEWDIDLWKVLNN